MTFIFIFLLITIFVNNTGAVLHISDKTKKEVLQKKSDYLKKLEDLDNCYSDKKLGAFIEKGKTIFRLFAPSAEKVLLKTFTSIDDNTGKNYEMKRDSAGIWETEINGENYGLQYGFKVFSKGNLQENNLPLCIDPYAKAVASYNTYFNPRRSIIIKENDYDWEGDSWIKPGWRDLIIYEMHIRDMTAHPSAGTLEKGTYHALIEKEKTGGINYIKNLGVNAVEILPAQEFGNVEAPYEDSLNGKYNTWNPYEENYWGYMTAAFFAPESYYSVNIKKLEWNKWYGESAKQVNDFKDMVKAFHKENIAVIMDVVYNHLSEYETGNLKQIDKEYYFRLDEKGNFINESYTGNDLKTERPMMRRLIIESVLFWMKEYHIDGFRFDLGKLIDWQTIGEIKKAAQKINPDVIFICEPWGGGYDPAGFSLRGWASWNDQIRNGIKGENPFNGQGWIFGKWYAHNNIDKIKSYVNGTLIQDKGLFQKKEHSVNYLESHDGYTLGDFIRIASRKINPEKIIKDVDEFVKLTPLELKLNKLAALFLLTSQGITMISEGQEFARTKIIPYDTKVPDKNKGHIDHNSYEKDNETNYINYKHAEINKELLNYYKGLINLRNKYEAFRRADYKEVNFFSISENKFALDYLINYKNQKFIVLLNANTEKKEEFILPEGKWKILVNSEKAGINSLGEIHEKVQVEPSTGFVLMKK